MLNIDSFVSSTIKANQEIYKLLSTVNNASYYTSLGKGAGGDITCGMDRAAEDIFIKSLQEFGRIYSEESGYVGEGKQKIIIDPIDGSDNFLSDFPYYGTSVAYELDGKIVAGIIANLANNTIIVKTPEKHVHSTLSHIDFHQVLKNPLSKTGIFERAYRSEKYAKRLKNAKIKYRIPGAMALSLSLGHAVSFVILEGEMRTFDVAAGLYMCEDLYQHKTKDLTIICQQEKLFYNLKQILLEENA